MNALSVNYLTFYQKIRLALSVLIIYWPIRVYVNIGTLRWPALGHNLPFLAVEGVLTFGLLLGWVFLMDGLQGRLMRRFDQADTGELRLPIQLITLVVAIGLALFFNDLFGHLHQRSERKLEREFPTLGRAPDNPLNSRPNDRGSVGT